MDNDIHNTLTDLAKQAGFSQTAIVPTDRLIFNKKFRSYCEENLCGNYNAHYACPPSCGTVQDMYERTLPYAFALVLRNDHRVVSALDPAEIRQFKTRHNEQTLAFVREAKTIPGCEPYLLMGAGPCSLCRDCLMRQGLPCPHPDERFSCMSAYCLDVDELAKACGMALSWSLDQASFFSLFLFRKFEEMIASPLADKV